VGVGPRGGARPFGAGRRSAGRARARRTIRVQGLTEQELKACDQVLGDLKVLPRNAAREAGKPMTTAREPSGGRGE
jgi:hypothetical protein